MNNSDDACCFRTPERNSAINDRMRTLYIRCARDTEESYEDDDTEVKRK